MTPTAQPSGNVRVRSRGETFTLRSPRELAAWLHAVDGLPRCSSCAVISPDSRVHGRCRICRGAA